MNNTAFLYEYDVRECGLEQADPISFIAIELVLMIIWYASKSYQKFPADYFKFPAHYDHTAPDERYKITAQNTWKFIKENKLATFIFLLSSMSLISGFVTRVKMMYTVGSFESFAVCMLMFMQTDLILIKFAGLIIISEAWPSNPSEFYKMITQQNMLIMCIMIFLVIYCVFETLICVALLCVGIWPYAWLVCSYVALFELIKYLYTKIRRYVNENTHQYNIDVDYYGLEILKIQYTIGMILFVTVVISGLVQYGWIGEDKGYVDNLRSSIVTRPSLCEYMYVEYLRIMACF